MKFVGNVLACACGFSIWRGITAAWNGDAPDARAAIAAVIFFAVASLAVFWIAERRDTT